MTSLSWKRKLSSKIQSKSAALFTLNDDDDNTEEDGDGGEEDWTRLLAKKKCMLEDSSLKSAKLMEEGIGLAEQQRYQDAIDRFNDALSLSHAPDEAKLYEMKAQALLELNEVYLAVQAASKAVNLNPLWAEAYLTLGRTQINFGDIKMAVRSFCIAIHLKPDFTEVYEEDLSWALDLLAEEKDLEKAVVV